MYSSLFKTHKVLCLAIAMLSHVITVSAIGEFSTAGFHCIEGSGRDVYNMNAAWRFHKGDVTDAHAVNLDDSEWKSVNLPHGIDYLPVDASGSVNYQGIVWYRKHLDLPAYLQHKRLFLHFEAIMGKSNVYVNGALLCRHYGGYLPVVVDVTDKLLPGKHNVIAVMADNSNDGTYPPGKPQQLLDFTYGGGIYRDCWLVAHNNIFITDANYEKVTAGGGVLVAFDNVSERSAKVIIKTHVRNKNSKSFSGVVSCELQNDKGTVVSGKKTVNISSDAAISVTTELNVSSPMLWSPDNPQLYNLIIRIKDKKGNVVDGYRKRVGIRSFEFKGKDGFYLNGHPYTTLIGANRHQDYAIIGNAVPNSMHWRDAKMLRDAGFKVIRNAHCPQDPAFMDACDELGLLVIVNTPGWQFWNNEPVFAQRVYDDIRNMVRRDRNHASVWLWEPILNETSFPDSFAYKATAIVKEEYPYKNCFTSCDSQSPGHEQFKVQFMHPDQSATESLDDNVCYFTREWGDDVDDWNAQNSPSRVARSWGEQAMLVQANHYAESHYPEGYDMPYRTTYDVLCRTSRQHIGGCLWHSFDHQRGYHPDPFYGGIADAFRQPKYSYYMFMSQRPVEKLQRPFATGPMVYIANEMSPFSPSDVTVFSNCDQVRLTVNRNGKVYSYTKEKNGSGMPSPVITFTGAYDFHVSKQLSMKENRVNDVYMIAEGLMNGETVVADTVRPARRPRKVVLEAVESGAPLIADGSDVISVTASVVDEWGTVKRLNNSFVSFRVEGEGCLINNNSTFTNPMPVRWGNASALIQSTLKAGKIRIYANVVPEGAQTPVGGVLEIESHTPSMSMLYDRQEAERLSANHTDDILKVGSNTEQKRKESELLDKKLKEVERQQSEYGEFK